MAATGSRGQAWSDREFVTNCLLFCRAVRYAFCTARFLLAAVCLLSRSFIIGPFWTNEIERIYAGTPSKGVLVHSPPKLLGGSSDWVFEERFESTNINAF